MAALPTTKRPRIIVDGYRRSDSEAVASQMDWQARFRGRSPLARKVITFNLLTLGVLVLGVLYLNQYQDGLLAMRERAMMTEGNLIVAAIEERTAADASDEEVRAAALDVIASVAGRTPNRIWIYAANQRFLGSARSLLQDSVALDLSAEEPQWSNAFTSILGELWARIDRLYDQRTASPDTAVSSALANPVAREAIDSGGSVARQLTSAGGQTVLTVGMPLEYQGIIRGALTLTTPPGEIDELVRGQREQVLQVFALAIVCSVLLSLVLSSTIVRPLRDLAEAAQESGTRTRRKHDERRVEIPDLTARPDEIGFLSGALQAMTNALYDRIEANEMFAADVAHEIKNPLTSLRSAVETMPYAKEEKDRQRLLEVIKHDVDRLNRLVTDISNASRLDSELVRDEMLEFDLHRLLTDLVSYNAGIAEEHGATLETHFPATPLEMTGLEGRLAQVFVNLITNAISFAVEGDTIAISTEIGRGIVRVKVEDMGPGIPDQSLEDIFSRFYSERPKTETFGNHSGLGLAISKQIVEAHGGRIWAENIRTPANGADTPPDGARMVVELPL